MKRIINTLLFMFATVTMMAQNSFVVADKNGNSQLVQSLIFQQQQNADRFTWKSDGTASGDIKDVFFIARAQAELATADADDVTKILENASGTDGVSAEAFASALHSNTNIEDVYSADDNNLVVTLKDGGGRVIYPMYEMPSLFSEDDANAIKQGMFMHSVKKKSNTDYPNGTVAIFSTLKNNEKKYAVQIRLVENIKSMFKDCGYKVEEYESGNFTESNFKKVLQFSSSYTAIIVMSHGALIEPSSFINNGKGVLVSGEECDKYDPADKCYIQDEGKYYKTIANDLPTSPYCLVYLGSCYGVCRGEEKFSSPSFGNSKPAVIGWRGVNSISQAHAAMLFYRLLYLDYTVEDALALSFISDPNFGTPIYFSPLAKNFGKLKSMVEKQPQYHDNLSYKLYFDNDIAVKKRDGSDRFTVAGRIYGEWSKALPEYITCQMKPLFSDGTVDLDLVDRVLHIDDNGTFFFRLIFPLNDLLDEGIYQIEIGPEGTGKTIKPQKPFYVVYSRRFGENYALSEPPQEDVYTPSIVDDNGQSLEEITVAIGANKIFDIDGYRGHSFRALSLDEDKAKVSVSGTSLTVTGVEVGTTYIGVQDYQNKLIAVAEIIVPVGGISSIATCPDDHHPHLIDLGLPSGTKWACCNVGASKPEEDGKYYAWGETEEKDYYDYYNYLDGRGACFIGKDIAGTDYDVAHVKWGGSWVMPNLEQINELLHYCSSECLFTENGIYGCLFSAENGASIFFPAEDSSSFGSYWTSTLDEVRQGFAYVMYFYWDGNVYSTTYFPRVDGRSVRPVIKN